MLKPQKKRVSVLILSGCLVLLFFGCSLKKIDNKRAMFLYQDGMKLSSQGNFDGAIEKFDQSIAISEKHGFAFGVAHNYNEIGNIYTYKKQFNIARQYFQKALAIYQEKNMATEISKSMDNIAKTYMRQGDYPRALVQYETLLSWDKTSNNTIGTGITAFNIGLLCEKYILDFKKAKTAYEQALEIFLKLNRKKEAKEAHSGIQRMTF